MRCVFCGKNEEDFEDGNIFTIEHIIPKSLGNNRLKLDCVCKKCNSNLGKFVDDYFVNNMLIKIERQILGIKGQSGRVPNAFEVGKDDEGNIIRLDNEFKPSIVSNVKEMINEDGSINIKINAKNKEEARKILEKKLIRSNVSQDKKDEILKRLSDITTIKYRPKVNYSFVIDLKRYSLEIAKIAYEYMIFKFGEKYYSDNRGIYLKNYLNKAINGKFIEECENIEGICLCPLEISDNIRNLEDSIGKSHILMFIKCKNQLLLLISLFLIPAFTFIVVVSNDSDNYDTLDEIEVIQIAD